MRIAIVSVPSKRSGIPPYVNGLQKGFEAMGHHADILDAWTDDGYRLASYEYIAVAAETNSYFSSKLPDALSKVLATGSGLSGRKSAAFLGKKCLFINKALARIMAAMEKEGMVVNWSETILSPEHATALAKRIGA